LIELVPRQSKGATEMEPHFIRALFFLLTTGVLG